ncbi:MAG: PEP-utilizing enzyme [bacterium]
MQSITTTGNIASSGRAKGRVRLLHSIKDADKINKGDIVVAQNAAPAHIAALKNAAGFITEKGGVLSPLASEARRLRIPCLVGARDAMGILKDGDIVEMNNGEIKILS